MALRPVNLTFVTAFTAGALTLLISVLPWIEFAYRSPSAHVALETTAALTGLVAAYLIAGRYRETGTTSDLVLAAALAILAGTNLFFGALPDAFPTSRPESFFTWARVAGSLVGAAAFAAAAFSPTRPLRRPRRAAVVAAAAVLALLAAIAIFVAVYAERLPIGLDPGSTPQAATWADPIGHPAILAAQLSAGLLFALAAVGFTRRVATGNGLMRIFAAAATLGAFARLNYFLYPSLYSEWIYTGDVFRLCFYLMLLVGVARELSRYQHTLADAALLEERRRLARDLHDGLAQELAFILGQTRALLRRMPERQLELVCTAAERALAESREAITALTTTSDEPLEDVVAETAREVTERTGAALDLDLAPGIVASVEKRQALVRVAREAVTNAVRHGGASRVTVRLANDDRLSLRIVDNGRGFDPSAAVRSGGFGLTSMRERAQALGGRFQIRSQEGKGTEVEVELP